MEFIISYNRITYNNQYFTLNKPYLISYYYKTQPVRSKLNHAGYQVIYAEAYFNYVNGQLKSAGAYLNRVIDRLHRVINHFKSAETHLKCDGAHLQFAVERCKSAGNKLKSGINHLICAGTRFKSAGGRLNCVISRLKLAISRFKYALNYSIFAEARSKTNKSRKHDKNEVLILTPFVAN